jgi:hypothetical protein
MARYIIESSDAAPGTDCSSGAGASSEEGELCRFRSLHARRASAGHSGLRQDSTLVSCAPSGHRTRSNLFRCVAGLLRAMMSEVRGYAPGRTTAEFAALGLECGSGDSVSTPAPEPVDTGPMAQYVVDAATSASPVDCSDAPEGEDLCE